MMSHASTRKHYVLGIMVIIIAPLAFFTYMGAAEYDRDTKEAAYIKQFVEDWNAGNWQAVAAMFGAPKHPTLGREAFFAFIDMHRLQQSHIIFTSEVVHRNWEPQAFLIDVIKPNGTKARYRVYTRLLTTMLWLYYFSGNWTFVDIEPQSIRPRNLAHHG